MSVNPTPFQYRTIQALLTEKEKKTYLTRFLIKSIDEKITRAGQPYHSIVFSDKTGSFVFSCWSDQPIYPLIKTLISGAVIEAQCIPDFYNSQFSPRIPFAQVVDTSDPAVLKELIESPKEDIMTLWGELNITVNTKITDPELLAFTNAVVFKHKEALLKHPAARTMHHAYTGGLLEHTVHMLRVATRIMDIYPSVNKDIAIAGIVVHDLGKLLEYNFTYAAERTQVGNFLGHIILGIQILRDAASTTPIAPEKLLALEHIIASHMQKLEWGAATLPASPEAVFVSMVDNLDARLAMVEYTYDHTQPETFSTYSKGLETCLWRSK